MKNLHHAVMPQRCPDCVGRMHFFCNLPERTLADLQLIKVSTVYPKGSTIFMEGQPARGVFLLCSGRAKLSTCSEEGRAVILRIANVGELIGLNASISGAAYEKTAHAIDDCLIGFIKRSDFLNFISSNSEASLNALKQMSHNYNQAFLQICSLGLSASVGDKLARLLLQWSDRSENGGPVRIKRSHTHGEIAEMIGTSRETVTRLMSDFRERGLIQLTKTELEIPDRNRLKAAIGGKHRNGHFVM